MRGAREGPKIVLQLMLAGFALAGTVAMSNPAQQRAAGETIAQAGVQASDPAQLIAGLTLILENGATLDTDDPWDGAVYLDHLRALSVENGNAYANAIARLSGTTRGTTNGPSRIDGDLPPGATVRYDLRVVPEEAAIIEVRLKQGSAGADVDLKVQSETGQAIAQDLGPDSGVMGIGAYAEFIPENCQDIQVVLTNAGSGTARFAVLAPPSNQPGCND